MSVLPLYHQEDIGQRLNNTQTLGASASNLIDIDVTNPHLEALEKRPKHLKFMHLNTQSMVSTFDELLLTVKEYPFDAIAMSETWLKNNELLLQHVTIPGYSCEFRNRESIKGGGVGAYIKESVKYKRRTDIENKEPDLEHLWLELAGRNKNSKMLMGIMYRSNRILTLTSWLDKVESLFGYLTASWNGLLVVTGDMNIDLMPGRKKFPFTRQYLNILSSLNLHQHVTKPTRTTKNSSTLIDHIISNSPERITFTDVLPCPLLSDHDAVYPCVNIKVTRFQPRYKYIRDERNLDETAFIEDVKGLPMSAVYGVDDPEEQLEMFNTMLLDCLNSHAPLRRVKITRPPAPWLQGQTIRSLQNRCRTERHAIQGQPSSETAWQAYRDSRNELKKTIKKSKRQFVVTALSS